MSGVIGVFGGTFNPIHYGHLILASLAFEAFQFKKVLFVPNNIPPHRDDPDLIDGKLRLEMVRLAISGDERFEVSDVELRKEKPSYTFETILELKETYGKVAFICGKDALLLSKWYRLDDVLREIEFLVVANRVMPVPSLKGDVQLYSSGDEVLQALKRHPIIGRYMTKVRLLRMPFIDISSTMLRERVRRGLSVRYFVPDRVERFIREKGLYREG